MSCEQKRRLREMTPYRCAPHESKGAMSRRQSMQVVLALLASAVHASIVWGAINIDVARPRIALSFAYLRDALNTTPSVHTRMRCASNSIYLCCCELASARGVQVESIEHPNARLVRDGLAETKSSSVDRRVAHMLMRWSAQTTPILPGVSVNDACLATERIYAATLRTLSLRSSGG